MKQQTIKNDTWNMRAAKTDKAQIKRLAKRLGCSESAAVRRAILHTLATIAKGPGHEAIKKG